MYKRSLFVINQSSFVHLLNICVLIQSNSDNVASKRSCRTRKRLASFNILSLHPTECLYHGHARPTHFKARLLGYRVLSLCRPRAFLFMSRANIVSCCFGLMCWRGVLFPGCLRRACRWGQFFTEFNFQCTWVFVILVVGVK
jgi:hypothetical protein